MGIELDVMTRNHCLTGLPMMKYLFCVTAERSLLRELEGGCQIPIGARGVIKDKLLYLEAVVASLDGSVLIRDRVEGPFEKAIDLGLELAEKLKQQGATKILEEIRQVVDCGTR